MRLEKFSEKIHSLYLDNKKKMIELIESMEELIHQKKSNSTIKYVVNKILERIILNIHIV